ncbi:MULTISPECIES: hypothetical protein [Actinomadura]|uniref:Dolichyl-phosphate-mannose-protein mannosyltransferase n=1 Tax=Actinomadura madurae TaxID=1993 RepID=A0A1I5C4S1_9ACTN|nr:hypothetical protein [Actinomadura madurae]SFN82060.1 hypothetical protein SAMN04489713_103145 [Actinomadura madurae]SPT50816.1 Uncharacterised protein [Actinomadura madurae]
MRVRFLLHLPFACVLAVAVWIRVIAVLGYPAPMWFGDSPEYLESAIEFRPGPTRPSGYPFLLWLIKPFHSFTVMVSVQHAIGVLTGVLVYVLVWRAGRAAVAPGPPSAETGRWAWRAWLPGALAALLTVPVLLPVHQVALEHMLMSDSLFTFLLLAAVAAALWRRRAPWWLAALAGVLAAAAALTRSAGLPLIAVILVAMLVRRAGWRACAAAAMAFTLPIVGYMFWFKAEYGRFTMAKAGSIWLYGRTATFADCRVIEPRPELRVMCPERSDPRISRPFAAMWTPDSPFRDIPGWIYGDQADDLAGEFAVEAIKAQPVDYAKVVVRDTLRAFEWNRGPYPTPWTWLQYEFPEGEAWSDEQALAAEKYDPDGGETRVVRPWAGQVLAYQDHVAMPGTILGVLLLGGLAAALPYARSRGRWEPLRPVRHWGTGALLPWGTSLALLVIPAATADFDYRYVVPAVPFACVALGLALLPPFRRPDEEAAEEDDRPASREKVRS